MLSFLNFNARQLASTNGFSRKVNKVASILGIRRLLYSEIINIEESSIDVLLVDEKMYFYKVHLYSLEATKMLNDEFNRFLGSLGYTINDSVKIEKLPDMLYTVSKLTRVEHVSVLPGRFPPMPR